MGIFYIYVNIFSDILLLSMKYIAPCHYVINAII